MTVQPGRRLLLIGAGWAAESLSRQLSEQDIPWLVSSSSGRQANLAGGADLLLWLLQEAIEPQTLEHELRLWRQQWPHTPLLLVLPVRRIVNVVLNLYVSSSSHEVNGMSHQ